MEFTQEEIIPDLDIDTTHIKLFIKSGCVTMPMIGDFLLSINTPSYKLFVNGIKMDREFPIYIPVNLIEIKVDLPDGETVDVKIGILSNMHERQKVVWKLANVYREDTIGENLLEILRFLFIVKDITKKDFIKLANKTENKEIQEWLIKYALHLQFVVPQQKLHMAKLYPEKILPIMMKEYDIVIEPLKDFTTEEEIRKYFDDQIREYFFK